MFETLGEKLDLIFRRLRSQGRLTERIVDESLREVRLALLEADVHFQVVRDFIERVRTQAVGQEVLRSLTPEQHLVRIVHRELAGLMGGTTEHLRPPSATPAVLMLVGLQGSGKTTTTAKLAGYYRREHQRRPYLVAADLRRPAAVAQLAVLGEQLGCAVHPVPPDGDAPGICRAAVAQARAENCDLVLIDTAGRLHVDAELLTELEQIVGAVGPQATLLVVDAMTGQDAINVARGFHERLNLEGTILTKMEGDARGGAALSLRAVTGRPIYFVGVGEKLDALEVFHPERMASRVLGMGDVLTLIEKAERAYTTEEARAAERKLRRDEFTLEDFREQLRALRKMGPLGDLLSMVPGMKKLAGAVDDSAAETELRRVEAIINSMTRSERQNVGLLNASRRRRIAQGSGTTVADVNRFVKQFQQTKKMMRRLTKSGRGAVPGLPI